MNRDCNYGFPPVYPNFPTPPMPNFPTPPMPNFPTPFQPNPGIPTPIPVEVNTLENQVARLQQQVDSLDRRVSRLEGMMGPQPTQYPNTNNFQMM